MLYVDERCPINRHTFKTHIPIHVICTIPYSVAHVLLMVCLRKLGYAAVGGHYDFGDWGWGLFYEYLKDFRTYFSLLSIVYLYRFVLFRLQGEASLLAPSEVTPKNTEKVAVDSEHLLVKKLGKEFLIRIGEIEWLEACGNYVNLHLAGRIYPYRGTMKSLESRLAPTQFVRIHRSYMVNFAQIQSIEPLESGDARVQLKHNKTLPLSRRYRAELKQLC